MLTRSIVCLLALLTAIAMAPAVQSQSKVDRMLVRIAEIEIDPRHAAEYLGILKREAAASVKLEPGVVCIFPMTERSQPNHVRLLEIYASQEAYEAHLKSPHFLEYKSSTLPMIKSLRLVDMNALDVTSLTSLFVKATPR